jgi:Protein of unknown function with PCYCGC motif
MLNKGVPSFQKQDPIISYGEISMTKSFLAGLCLISLFLIGCGANRDSTSASSSNSGSSATPRHSPGDHAAATPTKPIPAHFLNVADARPLPAVLDPKRFSDPSVVKAYGYAKEIPEVFAQQPCYCYCDKGNGHRSLLDCFATDHGAA